ncbi:MAG: DUF1573 domain-containing protein [Patescibacteria group bacterium]|nr:DUF1573 domain-containing protein [Patescibacteria group bacterium]
MNEKKIIILLALSTVAILFGAIFLMSKSTATVAGVVSSQNAKMEIKDPTSFDWGDIQMEKGDVEKDFTIKSVGTEPLKIYNVKTSCHCTIARVTIDKEESPNFGMSGVSSWVGEVAPGKEAKLAVIFDPQYHGPQGVGPINRFVSIETNDKGNSKVTFTLTGTVVKKS